jgi:1,4-alpha-glucan branching enzyme
MRQGLLSFFMLLLSVGVFAQSSITLSVDMNDYPNSFTTPHLSGSFNGWSGDANPMEDADGDGIWTTTVMMDAGSQDYKFQVDGWVDQEFFMEGMPCTLTTDGFTNRNITVDGDATIETVCWGACVACEDVVEPTTYNVTLSVNMSEYTADFTTIYLSGTFNGWSGDANPMEDADGDGIWTTTVMMGAGAQEYKFQADAWTDQEALVDGMPCTGTFGEFVNRIVTVTDADVSVDAVCWNSCADCGAVEPAEGNITLSLNMNEYTGTFTTPFLSGAFNGWSADANPMEDADGDGIWTTTVLMGAGQQDFKFQLDSWTDQELWDEANECTMAFGEMGEFINRVITVDGDATIGTVCWNSCDDCGGGVEPVDGNITLSLNMNEYTGTFTTPFLSGAFNGWSADANPMEDADGDGIWTTTVLMGAGQQDFKFQLDSWTDQELWDEANECTMAFGEMGEFINRVITVDGDATIGTVCWNSCNDCGVVEPAEGNITLSLNMEDYPGAFTTPYVSGNFNGWSADANPMEDADGDGIWTATILLAAGSQEYKFQVDNWTDQEMLMEGMPCTMTSGEMNEFTNRIITVDGDASIDVVCWESCADCDGTVEPGAGDITFSVNMNDYTGAFTTVYISGNFNGWSGDANPLEDTDGDGIWSTTLALGAGPADYKFQLDAWTDQEMWDEANECTMAFGDMGQFINRVLTVDGDATLPTVCWNSCEDCDGGQAGSPGNITLSVNMNTYTEPFTTVFLSGSFNGWSGDANPMEDTDGDGVWTTTVSMDAGLQDFKFQLDAWTAQEIWAEANECTMAFGDMGEFINRVITVDGDATLDVLCWQECQDCTIAVEDIVNSESIFTLQPTLAQEFTVVKFSQDLNSAAQIFVSDALGKLVYSAKAEAFTQQQQINTANWTAGTYFVRVTSENKMAVRRLVITK